MVFAIVSGTGTLFLYCHFGKLSTDSYLAFADCVYNSDWIFSPAEFTKYYALLIMNAQRSLYYHGSNIVHLNLETYNLVLKIEYISFDANYLTKIFIFS